MQQRANRLLKTLLLSLSFTVVAVPLFCAQTPSPGLQPSPADAAPPSRPSSATADDRLHTDWAYLSRYRDANAALPKLAQGQQRVVFMGDSITENWGRPEYGGFFPGKGYLDRGISGQTTPQMLIRLRPDVIDLGATVMVLLGGTNDIAGNTGPMSLAETEGNLRSMTELARLHGIRVILCSAPPASSFPWKPGVRPAQSIVALNTWIKAYAAKQHLSFVDYYPLLVNDAGGMRAGFSSDGVHPNAKAYALMMVAAQRAIDHPEGK